MLVRGPWALSSAVTATKHRLGYVIIILYHWWYFNWGGPGPLGPPPGYAYASDINPRREDLLAYCVSADLNFCNVGNKPTFRTKTSEEVLDLT